MSATLNKHSTEYAQVVVLPPRPNSLSRLLPLSEEVVAAAAAAVLLSKTAVGLKRALSSLRRLSWWWMLSRLPSLLSEGMMGKDSVGNRRREGYSGHKRQWNKRVNNGEA